jgi:CHASE2 domain-containing sensor protein
VIATIFCLASWWASRTSIVRPLEQRLLDAEFHVAPASAPDSRLSVVLVDDRSLAQDPTLLGERADEFADRLEQIFGAGARGVALDFLLPQRWSSSSRFSRFVLTHADHLTLGALSTPDGLVVGPESVSGLTAVTLGPQRASELFGFVNIQSDSDGITRRARLFFTDAAGSLRDSFSTRFIRAGLGEAPIAQAVTRARARAEDSEFLIDASVDPALFPVVSWSNVPDAVMRNPALFRDRLVLIGGDYAGTGDLHWLRGMDAPTAGVVLQAMIANTTLEALPIWEVGFPLLLPLMALTAWVAAERSMRTERLEGLVWTCSCIALWVAAAIGSFFATRFFTTRWVVPVVLPVAMIAASGTIAVAARRFLRPFPHAEE